MTLMCVMMKALLLLMCVSFGHGSMMNKCLKVLANDEFRTACSTLGSKHIRPCLVKTQEDADVLLGAKVIREGLTVPRNHICAARKEMGDADCVSVHVRPNPQQVWQWSEWRKSSDTSIRNIVITEDGTEYTCPYEERMTKQVFTDCLAAYNNGGHESGVYTISPDGSTELEVYCEQQQDGGGWTVLQRRQTGEVDFYRTWAEYKAGFGDLGGEYWLGNAYIHLLTKNQDQQVTFRLGSLDGEWASAVYSLFWIEDENNNYRLHMAGYSGAAIPGDSMLGRQNGWMFTTKDRDNDGRSYNCAVQYTGAWWYGGPCHYSNLNGLYGSTAFAAGLYWYTWKGFDQAMAYTAIMVKKNAA